MSAGGGLEQFLLLAKGTKGAAAAQLIHDALASPNVYVFGELLDIENIQALEGTEFDSSYQVLKMFTYGNYTDYKNSMMELPTLTPPQLLKLKHLSLITMAATNRTLDYSTLLDELDISNVRELEVSTMTEHIIQKNPGESYSKLFYITKYTELY
jgi:COP9 signalosome complex subunit 7